MITGYYYNNEGIEALRNSLHSVFIMLREDYVRHSATPFFTDYDLGRKNGKYNLL